MLTHMAYNMYVCNVLNDCFIFFMLFLPEYVIMTFLDEQYVSFIYT